MADLHANGTVGPPGGRSLSRGLVGLGSDVLDWLDQAGALLRRSRWNSALEVDEIDAWDASLTSLYQRMLRFGRDSGEGAPLRSIQGRIKQLLPWSIRDFVDHRDSRTKAARESARWISSADVLFWPREHSHVAVQGIISESLQEFDLRSVFVVSVPKVFGRLVTQGHATVHARGPWGRNARAARGAGIARAKALRINPGIVLPPFCGKSDQEAILASIRPVLAANLPIISETAAIFDRLRSEVGFRTLVVGNDLTIEGRVACLRAKAVRVPALSVMHGNVGNDPLQGRHIADRFLVFGENARARLLGFGIDPRRVVVTGAPHIEESKTRARGTGPSIRDFLGLAEGDAWVLVALSGHGHSVSLDHHLAIVRALSEFSAAHPEIKIAVRLHPKDRVEYYERAREAIPGSRLRVAPFRAPGLPEDIFDWLSGCSVVLTGASTVGVEAMMLGIPVVTVDLAGELGGTDYIEAGATIHVTDEASLESAVIRLLREPGVAAEALDRAAAFVRASYDAVGVSASRRCAAEIASVADPEACVG